MSGRPEARARTVRCGAVSLSIGVLLAAVSFAVGAGEVDDGSAVVISLVTVDVVLACAVGWASGRRADLARLGWLTPLLGVALVVGTLRHVEVSTGWLGASSAFWLVQPLVTAHVIGLVAGDGSPPPRSLVLSAVGLGTLAAIAGGAGGPGTPTDATGGPWNVDHPLATPVEPTARAVLLAASVVTVAVTVQQVRRLRRDSVPRRTGRVAVLWVSTVVIERVVHLLPVDWFRETTARPGSGGYRAWSTVAAVNVPLVAMGALLGLVLYDVLIGPRLRRVADGVLVASARPTAALLATLASWTGDPTLALVDPASPIRPGRARTRIVSGDAVLAALEHDEALARSPEVVDVVAGVAANSIVAEAHARDAERRVEEARRALARMVLVDAETREQLALELRNGPLADLRRAEDDLRNGAPCDLVVAELKRVTARVRALSHGLLPAELEAGGLGVVFPPSSGAPTRRLPSVIEVSAYLAARADPAPRFVDRGNMVDVVLASSEPDEACADRVEAVGGTVVRRDDAWVVSLPVGGGG